MPTKKTEQTIIEKVNGLLDNYFDTTEAIIIENFADGSSFIAEMKAANDHLILQVDKLEDDKDFDTLLTELEEHDDWDTGKILEGIGEDEVRSWFVEKGYALIQCDSMEQRSKLEDFVTTEMYPHNNDRDNFCWC